MSREIGRREFLRLTAAAGLGTGVGLIVGSNKGLVDNLLDYVSSLKIDPQQVRSSSLMDLRHPRRPYIDPVTKIIERDYKPTLNKDELMQFAKRVSDVTGLMPETKSPANQEELNNLVTDMIPFFEDEGIIDKVVKPKVIFEDYFEVYTDAIYHIYLLGRRTDLCFSGEPEVSLNKRFINPQSSWYRKGGMIYTLAHELAHVEKVCSNDLRDEDEVESSAEIVAMEILSSMITEGNKEMTQVLFSELKESTVAALYFLALKNGGVDEFIKFRDSLYDDPFKRAEWHKLDRLAKDHPEAAKGLCYRYSYLPLQKVAAGLRNGYVDITVYSPPKLSENDPQLDQIGEALFKRPIGMPRRIAIDDLSEVLQNAEQFAKWAAA